MLNIKILTSLFLLIIYSSNLYCQSANELALKDRYFRLMFYNVENLFDTENDSLTNDDEFLPRGEKFWTKKKYYTKLDHIASTIVSVGGWNPPEIIGLCEVENRKVLDDLCKKTGLKNLNYRIIHKESPDKRGIDVALLYLKKSFKPLVYKTLEVQFPFSPGSTTRDILYVKGLASNNDTMHVFINHWPSRWGGQLESEQRRMQAAKVLKNETDSVLKNQPLAKIIIMGDLNDYPDNKSLKKVLLAETGFDELHSNKLYNLSAYIEQTKNIGSHKHKGEWGILDQIIVSGELLMATKGLKTYKENAHIFNADFLLTEDEAYTGKKNFRTYLGYRYIGGYSDHLPILLDLENVK